MNGEVQVPILICILRKILRLAGLVSESPDFTIGLSLILSLLFFLSVALWEGENT